MLENVASYFVPVLCSHCPCPKKTHPQTGGTLACPGHSMKTKTHPKCFSFFVCFPCWKMGKRGGLFQRYAGNAFALFGILFQHFNAPTTVAPHSQTNTLRSRTVEPNGRASPQMELNCRKRQSLNEI